MTKQLKPRLVATALAIFTVLLLAACGGGGEVAEPARPTSMPAPSLEPAPSPTETTSATLGSDAPVFPEVAESGGPLVPPPDVPEELKVIWEAWALLVQDYVDKGKLDPGAFTESAIRGMLRVLEDPQTAYVSPEIMAGDFQDMFRGEFEGIGAHVSMNRAGKLVIVAPIEGSPAKVAGIRSGDIVLEVDGESIEGLGLLEAVAKIRGPKGSTVVLLVKHLGAIDPVEISVTRGVIPLISVYLRSEPDARFAHIRISDFYPNTVDTLRDTILEAVDNGAEGLILDVRDNPGGTLDAVVDVASQFLEDGLILYVLRGDGRRTDWKVRKGGVAKDIPMVVLVNEGSASSSEVLVGALQDHNRAKVIGATTFGKGSVNILRSLSNGGGLYITIAHWYTPSGRLIQDDGLVPDIVVEDRDVREADVNQLRRAIEELELMTTGEGSENISS